jgi:hypothetical protein
MAKVMGFHDELQLSNRDFSGLEIDATAFRRCVLSTVSLSQSSLTHVSFENCHMQDISLQETVLTSVSLFHSTVAGVDVQVPVQALGKLFDCAISGVHLVGARSTHLDDVVVRGSSFSGQLTRVSFVEDTEASQLSGTDLTGAVFESVRFVGIPMERVALPETETRFVVPQWHEHAGAVSAYASGLLRDYSRESPEYRAGFHVFHQVQQDWERYRFAHGMDQDELRGGRYLAEVRNQKLAPSVRKEVIEIYRTVTGVDFS